MNKIAFKVKKASEKAILQGHPWVYESSIEKQNKEGEVGDIAIIFNQRKNQFMAIGLYDPDSVIRIKILHKGKGTSIDKAFFESKIATAKQIRQGLLKTDTNAYRLLYGENDGMPGLIIDIYGNHAVVKLYSGIWFPYLDILKEILLEQFDIEVIVLRLNRLLQSSKPLIADGTVIYGVLENEEVVFKEHGLSFKANLVKGHKTGYFLDHRHNRLNVRKLSQGKKVLDIFSFAGGFSVNALAGGSTQVISLDISKQALAIAEQNVELNFEKANHKILAADAFEGLKTLAQNGNKFGLIIVDPPSFAKSADQIEGAKKSYKRLVRSVVPLIEKGGILLMASCSSRINKDEFFELVLGEIKLLNKKVTILEYSTHDSDHPEGIKELSYLKAIYLKLE